LISERKKAASSDSACPRAAHAGAVDPSIERRPRFCFVPVNALAQQKISR